MRSLTVVRPGMLTTIQDLGRWGQQHVGVPVAGPMDWYSHRLANRLLGNGGDCATLEITLLGPELSADADVVCAVAGAEFQLTVDGHAVAHGEPFALRAGQRLRFGARVRGARAYLAVRGGFTPRPVLGSRSTSLISRLGPFGGRALKAGDVVPVGDETKAISLRGVPLAMPREGSRLRVIRGPHEERFTTAALRRFSSERFTVTPDSNRMGYRLSGPALDQPSAGDMLSDATPIGSLQVPPSGLPILLMADRQTTGGYPKIATVISADLPLAGQLAPGDWIEFEPCSRAAAIDALRAREAALQGTTR